MIIEYEVNLEEIKKKYEEKRLLQEKKEKQTLLKRESEKNAKRRETEIKDL